MLVKDNNSKPATYLIHNCWQKLWFLHLQHIMVAYIYICINCMLNLSGLTRAEQFDYAAQHCSLSRLLPSRKTQFNTCIQHCSKTRLGRDKAATWLDFEFEIECKVGKKRLTIFHIFCDPVKQRKDQNV